MDFWSNCTDQPDKSRESLPPRSLHSPSRALPALACRHGESSKLATCVANYGGRMLFTEARQASATSRTATCLMPRLQPATRWKMLGAGRSAQERLCSLPFTCAAPSWLYWFGLLEHGQLYQEASPISKLKPSSSSPLLPLLLIITVFDSPFSGPSAIHIPATTPKRR